MISKLPKWVGTGACLLAFVGGFINVIGFLGIQHQAVTHLTGTTTLLAADLSLSNFAGARRLGFVILSFVFGCMLSGLIIQQSALQLGRRYGAALVLESALLCVSAQLLKSHYSLGICVASCACGLQNAMVTTYSGAVVRTTHLSGMFTDLGIFLGHYLRGLSVDQRRLRLCVLIIAGFFVGGIAGAQAFRFLSYASLFIPAAMVFAMAAVYALFGHKRIDPPAKEPVLPAP